MEAEQRNIVICHYCRNFVNDINHKVVVDKCSKWLNNFDLSDHSECEEGSSEVVSTNANNSDDDDAILSNNDSVCLANHIVINNNDNVVELDDIVTKKSNHYDNIQIYKSQNIHIGDVTHINGPVYVNQFAPTINQNFVVNNQKNNKSTFFVVSRRTWLAQPPLRPIETKFFTAPPKFVVICHSATEEAYTQTDNNLIVRLIQQFHVESRKWNDISYNFLVGADGSIYEGRGWKTVGAHTIGYNALSIAICFIGCFIESAPTSKVMKKARAFIKHGVEIGAIAEDYKLLGHCQCTSTESPGRILFQEMKTWERWDPSITIDNPSPLVEQII